MKYYSRRFIRPDDLNPANSLFGGQLLSWIDEEAAIFSACQMNSVTVVTKFIADITFVAPAKQGDVIEFGLEVIDVGVSSLTIRCAVRNKLTKAVIVEVGRMVFVNVNEQGQPVSHGVSSKVA